MGTQEFYIRAPAETESHGPYTLEQLVSLAEAGRIDMQTLYYDASTERWVTIVHNPDLKALLFPEKKRLSLKPAEVVAPIEPEDGDQTNKLDVNDMLAAADGRTSETKGKRDKKIDYERASALGRYGAILILMVSASALTLPAAEAITTFDLKGLLAQPQALLGLVDLFLALILLLGNTGVYPVIRFRAALGIGYFGILGWLQGHLPPTIGVAAGSVGLYLTTLFITYVPLGISILIGLAGMAFFAYLTLTT